MKRIFVTAIAAAALGATAHAQTLRFASQGDPQTMDPHSQNESMTNMMNGQVYEKLVTRDKTLAIVPAAGLTHAASGIAEALLAGVPMLVITGGIRTDLGKHYQLHEIDQHAFVVALREWRRAAQAQVCTAGPRRRSRNSPSICRPARRCSRSSARRRWTSSK